MVLQQTERIVWPSPLKTGVMRLIKGNLMRVETGQYYRNEHGALIRVLEPSVFDENGEEYFTYDVYDPSKKRWCNVILPMYKRNDCLVRLTLVRNSNI